MNWVLIFFIFGIILIVILLFIIPLRLVDPLQKTSNNTVTVPFPKINPKNLPGAASFTGQCADFIKQCNIEKGYDDCKSCGSNFSCTVVDKDNYEYNNTLVEKGTWCLPKNTLSHLCNPYTGRWVWSDSPSGQTWECICKYPNLYGKDNNGDCTKQIACGGQGKLQSVNGDTWDPLDPDVDIDILRINPYESDDSGKPKFRCNCEPGYARLQNDYFGCYQDPCQNLLKPEDRKNVTYLELKPDESSMFCNCKKGELVITPNGECASPSIDCGNGGIYDDNSKKCNCPMPYAERTCWTKNSKCTDPTSCTIPQCKNPDNPFGSECYDPCESKCNGKQCIPDSNTLKGYKCICGAAPDCHFGRKCSYRDNTDCTEFCVNSGQLIKNIGQSPETYAEASDCCSGRTVSGGFLGEDIYCA